MTTLADLTTPQSAATIEANIYAAIAAKGITTTAWRSGSPIRTFISGASIVLAGLSALQATIASGGFLDLASSDWLTLIAQYVYGVTRNTGTFASGSVTLTNGGGGVYSGNPGDLIVQNPTTGKTYRNTAAYSLAALGTAAVAVQADELGSASTSTGGTITAFVTPLLGVTVTNASTLVGTDPETDGALVVRCRNKTGAASPNGPADAYSYFAKSATRSDGTSIGITRVRSVPDGLGGIDLYVATASGAVTGTVGNLATDLGAVDDLLQRNCVPIPVTLRTQSAVATTIAVTYEIWIRNTGYTNVDLQTKIATALATYFAAIPIGGDVISPATGTVYVTSIAAVIAETLPFQPVKLVVTLPTTDTALASNAAPVLGTVTCTGIHQLSKVGI